MLRISAVSSAVSRSLSTPTSLQRSSGSGRHGPHFLPGDPAPFAGARGGRQGQPPLALRLVAGADVDPGGDDDHGLVVLGLAEGVQGKTAARTAAFGVGDPGPTE